MRQWLTQVAWWRWQIGLASLVFLVLTLPAWFMAYHVFRNFEPYPDGLLYIGQGWSWATGQGALKYNGEVLIASLPPVYPLILAVGYLIFQVPAAIYLTNLALGLASLFFYAQLVKQTTNRFWLQSLGLAFYVLNAYLIWLPGTPMAENVALLLVNAALYICSQPRLKSQHVFLVGALAVGLLLTKYAYVGLAFSLAAVVLWRLIEQKAWKFLISGAVITGLVASLLVVWFSAKGQQPLYQFMPGHFGQPSSSGITFYSFNHVIPNLLFYLKTLLGDHTRFLWQTTPLLGLGFGLVSWGTLALLRPAATVVGDRQVRYWWLFLLGWGPVFSLFYVNDARYELVILSVIYLLVVHFLARLKPKTWLGVGLGGLLLVGQILGQKNLWREVIASNWLDRSVAWQVIAVDELNNYFTNHEPGRVMTVLSPLFVSYYQKSDYELLPLSASQSFLEKQSSVWGSDVDYQNYENWLKQELAQGKLIYLTNAYLGHDSQVLSDYHRWQAVFKLELVAEGCLGTCNLYRLSL